MALSVRLNKVKSVGATGHIYLQWSDGPEQEFKNLQEIKDWAAEIDAVEAREILRKVLARWYFLRDPSAATPSTVEGKTITLDLLAATLLTVA